MMLERDIGSLAYRWVFKKKVVKNIDMNLWSQEKNVLSNRICTCSTPCTSLNDAACVCRLAFLLLLL